MTSLSAQATDQLGGPASALARRQERDHVELDRLLHELESAVPGPARDEVLNRIDRLVLRHAFAEEAVLRPAARRALPDGEALTLRVEQEHQEVNELVADLERLPPRSPEHATRLRRLVTVLREDVRDEQDVLLPRLQEALSVQELRRLGRTWELWGAHGRQPGAGSGRRAPGAPAAAARGERTWTRAAV